MPIPFIIGGIAAVAGVAGVGTGIHGGLKLKDANDTMRLAQSKQERAVNLFNQRNVEMAELMDAIGKKELEILASFKQYSDLIEKLQERPEFKDYKGSDVYRLKYEAKELKKVSAGAELLLGSVGGAAAGTAGGFAAAGATTSAMMALGTASTGTAISTLSGAALTNATLAALGGGALSAGGGGMALGSLVLSGATLGVGLLVGGLIFNATGSKLSEKADEAYSQALRTEREVNKIVGYFDELTDAASGFWDSLKRVESVYRRHLSALDYIIKFKKKVRWADFTDNEKQSTENAVLLVGLLYKMCQVNLVVKQEGEDEINKVNTVAIDDAIQNANIVLTDIKAA